MGWWNGHCKDSGARDIFLRLGYLVKEHWKQWRASMAWHGVSAWVLPLACFSVSTLVYHKYIT